MMIQPISLQLTTSRSLSRKTLSPERMLSQTFQEVPRFGTGFYNIPSHKEEAGPFHRFFARLFGSFVSHKSKTQKRVEPWYDSVDAYQGPMMYTVRLDISPGETKEKRSSRVLVG